MLEARLAVNDEEREAIYRHRYDVYVEELGRYLDRADHEGRRLVDPEDAHSDLFYVADDGEVVASLRTTWVGNDGATVLALSERSLRRVSEEHPDLAGRLRGSPR